MKKLIVLFSLVFFISEIYAKSFSSSRSSSSSSRSSFSSGSSSRSSSSSSSWFSSKPSKPVPAPAKVVQAPPKAPEAVSPTKKGWGTPSNAAVVTAAGAGVIVGSSVASSAEASTSTKSVATDKAKAPVNQSKTDLALTKTTAQASSQGKVYKSRSEAEADYRKTLTAKYDKEPTARPEHIPQSITKNGVNHTVVYHNGSYGYYSGNSWSSLDPLDFAIKMMVLDHMMSPRDGPQQPIYVQQSQAPVVVEEDKSNSIWVVILVVVLLVGLVLTVVIIARSN